MVSLFVPDHCERYLPLELGFIEVGFVVEVFEETADSVRVGSKTELALAVVRRIFPFLFREMALELENGHLEKNACGGDDVNSLRLLEESLSREGEGFAVGSEPNIELVERCPDV